MRKAAVSLSFLVMFLILAQTAGVVLGEDEDNGEAHDGADDMTLCTSAIFLLLLFLIFIALIVMGFSRKARKA
jgi:hypothetical protein